MKGDRASDDDDDERAVATTMATWPSVGYWGWFGFVYWGFLFFFDKHICALCSVCWSTSMFGLLSSLCLVCFCIGVWSLCQRRRDMMGFCQRHDGFNFWFSVFFFLVENPWACRERATCNGLVVGLALFYIYIYIFFFQILVQIFLGFFFAWK